MFPYSSNFYPSFLPSSSSSSSSSSPAFSLLPFLNPENASSTHHQNTLLHDPLISLPYHNLQIPETLNNLALAADNNNCALTMPKNDPSSGPNGAPNYGISCLLTKKPAKKDRHSKIYTSQGLRDRRVRLSIDIARKFFDLQDMLGFDKASNTLDWLFTKSKKAIKELTKSKNNKNSDGDADGANATSFTSDSECEDFEAVSDTSNLQQPEFLDVGDVKERKMKRTLKESREKANKMKESREKARARARERTSNKICINNNNNNKIFQQSRSQSQLQHDIQDIVRSPSNNKMIQPHHSHHHHLGGNEAPRDGFNVIEESIVIKRKLKPSMMVSHHHHHHQNLVAPKEASYNNSDFHSFPNSSPNWDANNGAPNGRSSFCAITSMNLSTGLQIFGKSWEECTNPRLH